MSVILLLCGGEKVEVLGTQKAPGQCPFCSGTVVVTDVEAERSLFCLTIYRKNKRRFSCQACNKRLLPLSFSS